LTWSISNDFGAIHSQNLHRILNKAEIAKNLLKTPYSSFKVIDVGTTGKLLSSVYDKQQLCVYLQPFSRYTSQ